MDENVEKPSLFVECPHCYTKVIPLANNICPACRSDISDLEGVDPNRFSFTIHEGEELPAYCFSCNRYTERIVRISGDHESLLEKFFFGEPSPERTTNVIIYLPQCDQCAELEEPEPTEVDYDHQTMTFAVHFEFRERVIRLRDNPSFQDEENMDQDVE
jgi:hypothetical protein